MSSVGAYAAVERRPAAVLPWAVLGLALAAVLVVYWTTFASLVSVWGQSDTFAHCFLIPPICLFLIWRRRARLARVELGVSWVGLVAMLLLSLAWAAARAANVLVVEHFSAVLLLPTTIVALLGRKAAREIAFPLGYLLFAVPFGEVLIPALMEWTAAFTVAALRVTGIPVFREGLYFSIPTGDFEVAKACRGIRYLIACSALGIFYAHLTYSSWRKRAIFVAASIVAPIVANGIRAYLIVIIAHLSSMRLAVGADHLVYGWVFFGGLVVLLFWIGNKFKDPRPESAEAAPPVVQVTPASRTPLVLAAAAAAAVVLAAAGPYVAYTRDAAVSSVALAARLPAVPGWSGPEDPAPRWYSGAPGRRELRASYARGGSKVELAVWIYDYQTEGSELVGSARALLDPEQRPEARRAAALAGGFAPREIVLRERNARRVVWYWYSVGGEYVAGDLHAKLLEAWHTFAHGRTESALILLAAEAPEAATARVALADFAGRAIERIDDCLLPAAADCTDPH